MPRQYRKSKLPKDLSLQQMQNSNSQNQGELSLEQDELLGEVLDAINNDEINTCHFLLQQEKQNLIHKFIQVLENGKDGHYVRYKNDLFTNKQYSQKIKEIWKMILQGKQKQQQNQQYKDDIRRINQKFYDEDIEQNECSLEKWSEESHHKNIKKLLETKFGYRYYGNVKCLMIAYGDIQPKQDSIKLMHSQIQLYFKILFQHLEYSQKSHGEQNTQRIVINKKMDLLQYLRKICNTDVKDFQQISRIYKKVHKKAKLKDESVQDFALDGQSQDIDSFDSKSQSQDLSEDQEKRKNRLEGHMKTKNIQQIQYFVDLTENMNELQYKRYSFCRVINFLSPKKAATSKSNFMKFIDPSNKIPSTFIDNQMFELFSFLGCKLIKRIIFAIIRSQNANNSLKKLLSPLDSQKIMEKGNQILSITKQKIEEYRSQREDFEKQAYMLFKSQIQNSQTIRSIFPKKVLKQNNLDQIWKNNAHYKKSWIQRVYAQKQINSFLKNYFKNIPNNLHPNQYHQIQQQLQVKINQQNFQQVYSDFFINNLKSIINLLIQDQLNNTSICKQLIFKKYMTGAISIPQKKIVLSEEGKPRKKVKLQSLKK